MSYWNKLIPLAEITLNCHLPWQPDPAISAYHGLTGAPFDFRAHPIAPAGTAILHLRNGVHGQGMVFLVTTSAQHLPATDLITSLSPQRPLLASPTLLPGFLRLKSHHPHLMQQKCSLPLSRTSHEHLNISTLPAILSLRPSFKISKLSPPCTLAPRNHALPPQLLSLLPRSCLRHVQTQGCCNLQFTPHLYKK